MPGRFIYATLGSARDSAAMKCARSSASAKPRGSSTWRDRKNPVSAKPSARSRPAAIASCFAQEGRQPQHLVRPRLARFARHRPARFRRHVNEIGARAGRHAAREIEPEAELGQKLQLEAHHHGCRGGSIVERIEDGGEFIVQPFMRIALGQQPHQRGKVRDAIDRMGRGKETRGPQVERLHGEIAEMLVEPRPPGGAHAVAGLQDRLHARGKAAAHQAEMAAVPARHHLEDAAGLPVALDAEHDAFIGPLHALV